MADNELKYKISADASKFVSEAQKAEKAAQNIGKGAASSPMSAGSLKNANAALDAHGQKVASLAGQYKKLESTRSFFDKQPKALAEIDKQQVSILKTLEKQSKSEQELSKYMTARLQLQERMGKNAQQYSAHSQRQFGQLQGAGMVAAGQPLNQAGAFGRQIYGQGMGTYQQLNSQYRFDPNLTASERGLTRSQVMLGSQLSGYQSLKNNVGAAINNSGFAAPLAMLGDLLGTVGPAAGSALQLAGSLKLLKGGAGAAGGLAGAAGGAGGGLAGGLGLLGKAGVLGGATVAGGVAGLGLGNLLGNLLSPTWKNQDFGDVGRTFGKVVALGAGGVAGLFGGQQAGQQTTANVGNALGVNNKTEQQNPFQQLFNSPQFKIGIQRQLNQISDFNVDTARQETQLRRGYARQGEDIARSRGRTNEDYAISQQRLGISAGRLTEDTTRSRTRLEQDYTKQITRLTDDSNRERLRSNQDYGRQVEAIDLHLYRVKRDTTLQQTRLEEDYTRNITRLHEDTGRQLARLEEDSSRNLVRLEDDSNRERTRSYEDYIRSKEQLSRQSTRSEQDINRGLSDTMIGLFAPGLASNKAYQAVKAIRDANIAKTRLRQDVSFEGQGIERSYQRSQEDINRGLSRGREDIGRELSRGREDIGREAARGEEDAAREKSRASFDLLKQSTDALKDAQIALRDTNTSYSRQQEDISRETARATQDANVSYARGLQDINTEYARGMQDILLQQRDAALQYQRSIEDLDVSAKRAKEDFETGLTDLTIARQRFVRDEDLALQEQKQSLMDLGASAKEAAQALSGLRGAAGLAPDQDANIDISKSRLGNLAGVGMHALGLNYVPRDNYPALLHKGEMILPAGDANAARTAGLGVGDFGSLHAGDKGGPQYQQIDTGTVRASSARAGVLSQFFGASFGAGIAQREANATAWGGLSNGAYGLGFYGDNGAPMRPPSGWSGGGNRSATNVSLNFTVNNDGEKRSIQAMGNDITSLVHKNLSGIGF